MGCNNNHGVPTYLFWFSLQILLLIQTQVLCFQYKVGDLDSWSIPTSANPHIYTTWSKDHTFNVRDSLLFLYPPSQDSVIQVTEESYKSCNLKDPILFMKDGNSLFNITSPGEFYFTSGAQGHCEKSQKLQVSVAGNGSEAMSPATSLPATSPSYPTVFGSIPVPASSSSPELKISVLMSAAIGYFICGLISGVI